MTGVLLAGGRNRRMNGTLKALLEWKGRPFLQWQLEEMSKLCRQIIIAAGTDVRAAELRGLISGAAIHNETAVSVITDQRAGEGPLAGMEAAMLQSAHEWLWVCACDMPFIDAEAARLMLEGVVLTDGRAVVPQLDGKVHPLHGLYQLASLPVLQAQLDAGDGRMIHFLDCIDALMLDNSFFTDRGIPLRFVYNVNDPSQYNELRTQYQ